MTGHSAADLVTALRGERLRQGLTMEEVAHRVFGSFDGSRISLWEKHRVTPRLDNFVAWAQSIGLEVKLESDGEEREIVDRPARVRAKRAW